MTDPKLAAEFERLAGAATQKQLRPVRNYKGKSFIDLEKNSEFFGYFAEVADGEFCRFLFNHRAEILAALKGEKA